jgi:hypothetical protein
VLISTPSDLICRFANNELMSKRMGANFDVVSDLFEKDFF